MRRRVLFLTCHLPLPAVSGGRRREYELISRLGCELDVHLCSVSKTPDEDAGFLRQMAQHCRDVRIFRARNDDGGSSQPYQVARHASSEAGRYVADSLRSGRYDLAHVEGFYLMQHVPDDVVTPVLLAEQNIEYHLLVQRARITTDAEELKCLLSCIAATAAWERAAWRRANQCVTVTPADRDHILAIAPETRVQVVGDGADHVPEILDATKCSFAVKPNDPVIAFVGNFAYEPNTDAARYLGNDILPRLRRKVPHVRVLLVGNAPPPWLAAAAARDGIVVTGRLPTLEPVFRYADVIVCPLRIGGGIKVKMLEALRAGKAIVSTEIGAQGLSADLRDAVIIADDPGGFAMATASLLLDSAKKSAAEYAVRMASKSLPSWDSAAVSLLRCYEETISQMQL